MTEKDEAGREESEWETCKGKACVLKSHAEALVFNVWLNPGWVWRKGFGCEQWMWRGRSRWPWSFSIGYFRLSKLRLQTATLGCPSIWEGASSVPFWGKRMKAPHFPYDSPPRSSSPAHFSWICRHRLVLSSGADLTAGLIPRLPFLPSTVRIYSSDVLSLWSLLLAKWQMPVPWNQ